jgi:hypothetical protein
MNHLEYTITQMSIMLVIGLNNIPDYSMNIEQYLKIKMMGFYDENEETMLKNTILNWLNLERPTKVSFEKINI